MTNVTHVLSESDLMLIDGYEPSLVETNENKLKNILWRNGMDVVNHTFEITTPKYHRNLRNKVVEDGRLFIGIERLDREWASTGAMSLAAVILSGKDPEHIKDMVEMAKTARYEEVVG